MQKDKQQLSPGERLTMQNESEAIQYFTASS